MESVKSLVDSLGVKRLALMGATALALIVGLYFLSSRLDSADYGILFTDLPPEQAQGITEKLRGLGVPFKLSADGTTVMAPSAKVPELRIQLAGEQITGQIGYELLDKQDPLGTSSFLQNVNHLRAIEGELVRSIETLNAVERARVHLVMPERQLFEKEAHKATASITLRTRAPLTQAQVGAIRNLVAAAVPDLSPDHVSIIDQNGTQLARPGDDAMGTASAIEEQRVAIQNRLREQIETMLERVVGPGHVRAEVSAALSQDNVREESEVYDPDRQVVDQQTTVQRTNRQNDADGTSGAVTVANQLPENQGGQQGGQTSSSAADETSEQVNYANSRTRTTTIRDAGAIAKLTVSVVVDGVSVAGPDGKLAYTPRSAAEIAKLTRLVENAIGFDSERGDSVVVENLRFVQPTELDGIVQGGLPLGIQVSDLINLAQTFVIGLLGLLAFFLILRPMMKRSRLKAAAVAGDGTGLSLEGQEERLALAPPDRGHVIAELIDRAADGDDEAIRQIQAAREANAGRLSVETEIAVAQIEGKLKSTAVKKVAEVINRNPLESAAIIRQWMYS